MEMIEFELYDKDDNWWHFLREGDGTWDINCCEPDSDNHIFTELFVGEARLLEIVDNYCPELKNEVEARA